jgi:hypothetical protein
MNTMKKLVLLTVVLLSINLAFGQKNKEELSFLEFIINESAETELTSSLEAYTFEKGNAEFVQSMRIVKDKDGRMTSIRLSKDFDEVRVVYDEYGIPLWTDTIAESKDPVLLSFMPFPITPREAFNSTHRIDTILVDGISNITVLDTVFTGHTVWVNLEEFFDLTYLKHTNDTLYLKVYFNDPGWFNSLSRIYGPLNDFRPYFNLECSYRNISIENLIRDIKDYSGEEIVAVDDELLTIKLKDDLLYFNIDAAKSITDSYVFYDVYGIEQITNFQEKLKLPSDVPKDIAVKLIPSSSIKNLQPIEYAFDIEPIKKFLEEKSW